MSGDAIDQVRDAQLQARAWDDARRELVVIETRLIAHGLAMQTIGVIPLHNEPEELLDKFELIDLESLRLKGTDDR